MQPLRLGQIDFLNCLPIYYAFETGRLPVPARLVKGIPTRLNELFLRGELEITPISSIEYARHPGRCLIIPGLSVSANGRSGSIFLISRVPVTELDGKKVCLPNSSATSVVLLKILFQHYYHIETEFETTPPDLDLMLARADAGLLIGDEALQAALRVRQSGAPLTVIDLGEVWKDFTGEQMVYALWVVRRDYARAFPEETAAFVTLLQRAREIGLQEWPALLDFAHQQTGLPRPLIEEYFGMVRLDIEPDGWRGLIRFFDYAYRTGLLAERVRLEFWGDQGE